jgi:hypothetical protein
MPRRAAGEHEIGDVGAGDQQQESDGGKQHQQRTARVFNQFFAGGIKAQSDEGIEAGVAVLVGDTRLEGVELGVRLR